MLDYVDIHTEFVEAESIEEERAPSHKNHLLTNPAQGGIPIRPKDKMV